MTLRKFFFWLHLCAGVVAGIVIFIMSVTGAAIAFEKDIVALMTHQSRKVSAPEANTPRLTVEELIERTKTNQPGARLSAVTIFADPQAAAFLNFGRTNFYVNPYTGEVREQGAKRTRTFMRVMTEWHRWLGREGNGRAVGKAITGACNLAFLFLALTGIYLWWPRQWSWTSVKGIVLFNARLRGKARDWNWHNVIGIWSAPVLIILTATATIISYRWASDGVYKITGNLPPGSVPAAPALQVTQPAVVTQPLSHEALIGAVQKEVSNWEHIIIRSTGAGGAGNSQPVSISVRERQGWPLFSSHQLSLDPYSGAVLKRESYADYNSGRKLRTWMRFLHTGEALGFFGKLVAGLASLGGAVLGWTGIALALRRLVSWRRKATAEKPLETTPS